MAGALAGSGKSRSRGRTGQLVPKFIDEKILPGFSPVQNQLFSQLSEALRTGGIGAQVPIVQQSVAQSQSALSRGLKDAQAGFASQGLGGTPFASSQLANAGIEGRQRISQIPTDWAQQQIGNAPQLVQGLLSAMLGGLSAKQETGSKSAPFST